MSDRRNKMKWKLWIVLASILVMALALTSCGSNDDPLAGSKWQATQALNRNTGELANTMPGDDQITLEFSRDGQLSGFSGCNNYSAKYTVKGNEFATSLITVTEKACEDAAFMDQENQYLTDLEAATSYQLNGKTELILKQADGSTVAVYQSR